MMVFPAGTTAAGVFTKNKCPGAPVDWCRAALKGGKARALVVTAGNSNVFTGRAGRETCAQTAKSMAELAGCRPNEVFLASTGVIGERLPTEKLVAALPPLFGQLVDDGWGAAARAIMTTDTFPKGATARQDRRRDGDGQRHRQGQRHDRPRHGDDALLPRDRRQGPGGGAAEDPGEGQ
jgi:glutamate N-acetyltransferase/amino-acid N-acetyltransferase